MKFTICKAELTEPDKIDWTIPSVYRVKQFTLIRSCVEGAGVNRRVGPKYIKFSDQAPNWAKVVPWYGV